MVTWDWKKPQGEIIRKNGGVIELYAGNAMLVGLYMTNMERTEFFNMPLFWNDALHAKKTLGLVKMSDGIKRNIYADDWEKVILYRNNWQKEDFRKVVALIAEAFDKIDIEIRCDAE